MTDDTRVRVQFYAQPWDSTQAQFLSQLGNPNAFAPAVFIGEDDLAPIPAFCGGSQGSLDPCTDPSAPRNWVFAQTIWDTSTVAANTDWKFWVVVWMERNGQKVVEIQDHGLMAIPGSPLNSLADVPIETYSNNLGFYNQVFHVGSIETSVQSTSTDRRLESTWRSLPRRGSLLQHQHVTVRARHRAFGAPLDDVLVLFYDGDPANHGELFDVENIPHISANAIFTTAVPFTPRTCGPHQLVVQAIPTNGKAKPSTDTIRVRVDCPHPTAHGAK